jgi:hypothetical protein
MATFDTLIGGRPASVQATARAARAYILSLGEISERYDRGEAIFSRGQKPFCAVTVDDRAVRLRVLTDPTVQANRSQQSAALRAPTDLSSAVRALVRAAYDAAR